jgi:hypothetical protein
MERDAPPAPRPDLPRVTTAVWEQMATAKRLLERLGAIRAAPRGTTLPVVAVPPRPDPDSITVAAGWGRPAR